MPPTNADSPSDAEQSISFETALAQLEEIVSEMDEGTLGLEAAMRRYEEAVGLLRTCYALLDRAEQRIELLTGFDREGRPELEPFDGTPTVEQPSAKRKRRG